MHLLDLIRSNFSGTFQLGELQKFMMNTCGVEVSHEVSLGGGDLYLFKYSQISANWSHPATHECRGTILHRAGNGEWSVASRPFDKFFNLSEGRCPLWDEKVFQSELSKGTLELREKKDGSCIQVWCDAGQWRASTLGTITPRQLHNGHDVLLDSLESLFWKLLGKRACTLIPSKLPPHIEEAIDKICEGWTDRSQPFSPFGVPEGWDEEVYDWGEGGEEDKDEWIPVLPLDPSLTYIFELCSTRNVIVTQYEEDHVSFLGARNNETGEISHPDLPGVNTPWTIPVSSELSTFESLWGFVEKNSMNSDLGKNPEGFVITKNGVPVAKLKNSKYLILHKYGFNDPSYKKKIIKALFDGILDDIYHDFTPEVKKYADSVSERISLFMRESSVSLSKLTGPFETRKDFALAVSQRVSDPRIRPFCFSFMKEVSEGNFQEVFESWVKGNKDEKFWKSFE